MSQLAIADVKFGDKIRRLSSSACLRAEAEYIVYRNVPGTRLYVVCIGPHRDNPENKDERGHTRHYLDACVDPSGTYLEGWEKA